MKLHTCDRGLILPAALAVMMLTALLSASCFLHLHELIRGMGARGLSRSSWNAIGERLISAALETGGPRGLSCSEARDARPDLGMRRMLCLRCGGGRAPAGETLLSGGTENLIDYRRIFARPTQCRETVEQAPDEPAGLRSGSTCRRLPAGPTGRIALPINLLSDESVTVRAEPGEGLPTVAAAGELRIRRLESDTDLLIVGGAGVRVDQAVSLVAEPITLYLDHPKGGLVVGELSGDVRMVDLGARRAPEGALPEAGCEVLGFWE